MWLSYKRRKSTKKRKSPKSRSKRRVSRRRVKRRVSKSKRSKYGSRLSRRLSRRKNRSRRRTKRRVSKRKYGSRLSRSKRSVKYGRKRIKTPKRGVRYGRRSRFGMAGSGKGGMGPGYQGRTSFQNGYVNYFGAKEPFIQATEAWYPSPGSKGALVGQGGKMNYQSPNMIYKY